MNKIQGKDKRRFRRLPAYHLVKYSNIITGAKDIGAGGLCIETKESIPVDSLIELTVNFPPFSDKFIKARARVKWAKKLKSVNLFRIGLEFIDIDESVRRDILNSVENVFRTIDSGKRKR